MPFTDLAANKPFTNSCIAAGKPDAPASQAQAIAAMTRLYQSASLDSNEYFDESNMTDISGCWQASWRLVLAALRVLCRRDGLLSCRQPRFCKMACHHRASSY
jgi:hypothetical protein